MTVETARRMILALALVQGCAQEPDAVLGRLEFYEQPARVALPSTVSVGVTFDVTVRTYGGGCIAFDATEIDVSGHLVEVYPFDRMERNGTVCTLEQVDIVHSASLSLDAAGEYVFRVYGRKVSSARDEVISREFSLIAE